MDLGVIRRNLGGAAIVVLAVAAAFGGLGLVGAADSAHLVLATPHLPPTTAGPAWLGTGSGVGVVVGTGLALGARRLGRRRRH